jgi:hydroxypyruvate isomerase
MIRFCPNLPFMYREAPFLERLAAAKDGFAGTEMTFPYDHAADEIRAAADRAGVAIVEFNAPAGPIEPGVRRDISASTSTRSVSGAYARAFDGKLLLSLAGVVFPMRAGRRR